jgi:hypothetical protein
MIVGVYFDSLLRSVKLMLEPVARGATPWARDPLGRGRVSGWPV